MPHRSAFNLNFAPLALCFGLIACGESAAPALQQDDITPDLTPDVSTLSGVFVDSPVEGLSYSTATLAGTTDGDGTFQYEPGETVNFSIGGIALGGAPGAAVITPISLIDGTDADDQRVANRARLLLALDADQNPANGIQISTAISNAAAVLNVGDAEFDLPTAQFGLAGSDIGDFLEAQQIPELPSFATAREHLNCSLGDLAAGREPDGVCPGENLIYSARIRRTSFGIPHIDAADWGGGGYGYGYAFAEDNLCVMAEEIVTVNGQRARYFGPDGVYTIHSNGTNANNLNSDFFYKLRVPDEVILAHRETQNPDVRAVVRGYTAGYNRYLRELREGLHAGRHAACRDEPWLRPIDEFDMYRRFYKLYMVASSAVFIDEIAEAQPPATSARATPDQSSPQGENQIAASQEPQWTPAPLNYANAETVPFSEPLPIGSNMYAFGSQATQNGRGMVFGNPHFPWLGPERFYQIHLTIPGEVNIMGGSLFGAPAVLIGFNEHFAWSHTVSTAFRFTPYELTLTPNDPTAYIYDGEVRQMTANELFVEVLQEDGSITTETRTLYTTHFGPMLVLAVQGVEAFRWTNETGFAIRDANYENDRIIDTFYRWDTAQSLDEFIQIHQEQVAIPWVNTVAAGSAPGDRAYYGDVSVVPNVPDSKVQTCANSEVAIAVGQLVPGLPVLDGSRSDCEWDNDDDSPQPGIFGAANLPSLQRDDHVSNYNDSYWLTNPDEPIEGFARIIGDERAERSFRTRMGLVMVEERLAATDGVDPTPGFNVQNLQEIVLSSRILTAELFLDDFLQGVCAFPNPNTQEACTVLGNWDRRSNNDSVGTHIWREFWRRADDNPQALYTTPFNANDPVNTPRGLNVASPLVQQAFNDAVTAINNAGIALDAPLGEIQYDNTPLTGDIPIYGGPGSNGNFTITTPGNTPINSDGYTNIRHGNSYIHTVTWDDAGNPIAHGFLTYSQSTDPANPHFSDQTQAYSDKQWVQYPFTEAEIQADLQSTENISEAVTQ